MRDIAVRPILWTAAVIGCTVAAVVLAVFGLLHLAGVPAGGARLRDAGDESHAAAGVFAAPQPELAQQRREKEAQLHSFGWVDRGNGVAHIPIDDAMDLMVAGQRAEVQR